MAAQESWWKNTWFFLCRRDQSVWTCMKHFAFKMYTAAHICISFFFLCLDVWLGGGEIDIHFIFCLAPSASFVIEWDREKKRRKISCRSRKENEKMIQESYRSSVLFIKKFRFPLRKFNWMCVPRFRNWLDGNSGRRRICIYTPTPIS